MAVLASAIDGDELGGTHEAHTCCACSIVKMLGICTHTTTDYCGIQDSRARKPLWRRHGNVAHQTAGATGTSLWIYR